MARVNPTEITTSLSSREILSLDPAIPVTSLYLHVPFCLQKCRYCDFYSVASCQSQQMDRFVDAVLCEASWWSNSLRPHRPISTVFFGGGTPSALPLHAMRRLLNELRAKLPIAADAEWSIEANPATIDAEYCRMLLESGVNRLSIGAQSFLDSELHMLGRVHDAQEIGRTVCDAQQAGFKRLSIDLMYAVPGQTLASWQRSLEAALALNITHISCYCLTLEEGTPMWAQTQAGQLPAISENAQLDFMRFTRTWLRDHGFHPYEISNYAAAGEECRHNLVYWESGNYLGLGPAAASHFAGSRWRNTPDLPVYLSSVLGQQQVPTTDVEDLSPTQRATELLMLMLRRSAGLTWSRFEEIVGFDGRSALQPAITKLTHLQLLTISPTGIQLTDAGCYVADEVIGELLRQLD